MSTKLLNRPDAGETPPLIFEPTEAETQSSRFGRRKILKTLGATLFGGVAGALVHASPAYAAACSNASPGAGCYGFKKCNCCSAYSCCAPSCTPLYGACSDVGYGSGPNYWYTCQGGYMYACADFYQSCNGGSNPCICRFYIGTC